MHASEQLGSFLLLFAPYLVACGESLHRPQLLIIWLTAACAAYVVALLSSLFFLVVTVGGVEITSHPSSLTAASAHSLPVAVAVVLVQVVLQCVARLAVLYAVLRVQTVLRREHQLIVWSEHRFVPTAAAVGFGFGFVSTALSGGAFFDAARRLSHYTTAVTAYNVNVCPQLPTLIHLSVQCFLLSISHVAWGVMAGQSIAALNEFGIARYAERLWQRVRLQTTESNAFDVVIDGSPASADRRHSPDARRWREEVDETTVSSPSSSKNAGKPAPLNTVRNSGSADGARRYTTQPVPSVDHTQRSAPLQNEGARVTANRSVEDEEPLEPVDSTAHHGSEEARKEGLPPLPASRTLSVVAVADGSGLVEGVREGHRECTREEAEAATESPSTSTHTAPAAPVQIRPAGTPSPAEQTNRILPADSILSGHPNVAFVSLVAVFVCQLLFASLSLVHRNAFDHTLMREVASRGCVVSLPLQLVLTTTAVLWALWIVRVEHVKLD